jgi:hypothetical protein
MPKPKNTGFPKPPLQKPKPTANTPSKGKYKPLPVGPTKPVPKNGGVIKGKLPTGSTTKNQAATKAMKQKVQALGKQKAVKKGM